MTLRETYDKLQPQPKPPILEREDHKHFREICYYRDYALWLEEQLIKYRELYLSLRRQNDEH